MALRPAVAVGVVLLFLGSSFLIAAPVHAPAALAPTTGRGFPSTELAPAHGVPRAEVHPAANYVNPFALIQKEPAPMGIADFGVTAAAGTVHAYSYGSPVFQGNVRIDSLYEYGGGYHYMTFQLNDVVVFTLAGQNYSYWIQDVASIDTQGKTLGWIDNIWNLSGSTGALSSAELSGNGTVNSVSGTDWYADSPSGSYPGGQISIAYPFNISERTVDSTIGGTPMVAFEYNDGYGWVTFDNVTFHHMHGAVNHGFTVDGYAYTPIGIFYDAEWVYTGSGSGQHNDLSNLSMSMWYWNGHNYQSPPNAWNFGSDTGESLSNVLSVLGVPPANGTLYSRLTNASGALGLLYNATGVSTLDVSAPTQSVGMLRLNGTPIAYRGGAINLTLAPGKYSLVLYTSNGTVEVDQTVVTVTAGETLPVTLPLPRYPVTFSETGLPASANWSVTVNGVKSYGVAGVALAQETNGGPYSYSVSPVGGYLTHAGTGTFSVASGPVFVTIPFYLFNWSVVFQGFGLPASTSWTVQLNGTERTTTTGALSFVAANGSYDFVVTTGVDFIASQPNGTVQVQGGTAYVQVQFVVNLGTVVGSVFPVNATVTLDGGAVPVADGGFTVSEVPGNYSFEATAAGYAPAWANISLGPGQTHPVSLTLQKLASTGNPPGSGSSGSSGVGGLSTSTLLIVAVVVVGAIVVVGAVLALRRRP